MFKILIDSNIYIAFIRTGKFEESIKALYTFRTRDLFFSSVVIQELLRGSLDAQGKKHIETLFRPFEKVGRIATPTHEDWKEAGFILQKLRAHKKDWKAKLPTLLSDTLIALSTLRLGAILYTANQKDFDAIASIKPFKYEIVNF
ncbi:MAG: type II toxin-antitoxin system VapC family toxin [Deltaproteobacteria bacterium]|nr:type II toxin-antitoxin system VapC family toxin [Deltaproteobacteria bacterium]